MAGLIASLIAFLVGFLYFLAKVGGLFEFPVGNPTIVTPGVSTYDFTRGETVLINRITGGNRALLTEVQRDTKMSVNYQPQMLKGLTVGIDYFRNRSTNPVEAFPILTPEIEAMAGVTMLHVPFKGTSASLPAVAGGQVILFHRVGHEETLECMDAKTGTVAWKAGYPTAAKGV